MSKICKVCRALDDPPRRPRPANNPGPRCDTHWREYVKTRRTRQHQRHVSKTYGLPDGFYDELYRAQDGRCAWCRKASGATRRLAVDHDHACCPGATSCGKCARGLLCGPCNQFLGYQMGDNPDTIRRGAQYLERPPAREVYMAWGGEAS